MYYKQSEQPEHCKPLWIEALSKQPFIIYHSHYHYYQAVWVFCTYARHAFISRSASISSVESHLALCSM